MEIYVLIKVIKDYGVLIIIMVIGKKDKDLTKKVIKDLSPQLILDIVMKKMI